MATFEQVFELINWNTVKYATTGALGVGPSTLTSITASTTNIFPQIDGATLALGDEFLVKDETGGDAPLNGHYFLVFKGIAAISPWIIQRVANSTIGLFDGDRDRTVRWMVETGSVNRRTEWSADPVANLGVDNVVIEKHTGIKAPKNQKTTLGNVPIFADAYGNRLASSSQARPSVIGGDMHVSGNLVVEGTTSGVFNPDTIMTIGFSVAVDESGNVLVSD